MDAETLKYYTALQPEIRKAMGEHLDGDAGYHTDMGSGIYYNGYYRFPDRKALKRTRKGWR